MNPNYIIPPVIGFALSVLLAMLVMRQHRRSFMHRIFFVFLILIGLWALTVFGMRISPSLEQALVWERATFSILPWVAVTFFHFVLFLTGATKYRNIILAICYSLLVLFVVMAIATNLLIADMKYTWYGVGFNTGPLFTPFSAIFYGIVLASIVRLIVAYRNSFSTLERNRYAYLTIGTFLCIVGLFIDFLASWGAQRGIEIYPMGIVANILFTVITSYAMLRYHLLDFRLIIRRGTVYAVVSAVGIGLVVGFIALIYLFGFEAWDLPTPVRAIFIICLALVVMPILRWLQNKVDKLFHREKYDYLRALEDLTEETKTITDLNFIAGRLVNMLVSSLRCYSACILLPDSEENYFTSVASWGMRDKSQLQLERGSILIWWLEQKKGVITKTDIDVKPHFKALSEKEIAMINNEGIELLAPLMARDSLRGILVIGRKLSGQDYSHEELTIIRVIARQMATSLDNARLYDFQVKRYQEQALLARLGMIVTELDLQKVYPMFARELEKAVAFDYFNIGRINENTDLPYSAFTMANLKDDDFIKDLSASSFTLPPGIPDFHYQADISSERKLPGDEPFLKAGLRTLAKFSLDSAGKILGILVLGSKHPNAYNTEDIRLLQQVAVQLAIAIDKSRLYELEKKARHELENQDKERTDFVNALVHEIKTPLTAMLASSELLREELASDTSALGGLAENMDVATRNLNRRISELTDFAKLQRAEITINKRTIDMNELARQIGARVRELLQTKQQSLEIRTPESPTLADVDPDRITQVLLNLLTNASKFTTPTKKIFLNTYVANGNLITEIRDGATPIKAEEMDMFFKPYYQRSKGKGSGGLGLGLFICHKFVQLHGGKIWIEPHDIGNSFKFSIPLLADSGGHNESTAH